MGVRQIETEKEGGRMRKEWVCVRWERWRESVRMRELMRQRGGKKRLDRLPCQTTVDLDVSGMETGLVMYTIWAKESGTDGIEAGEQEEGGAALLLLIYCHYEASLMCLRYHCWL